MSEAVKKDLPNNWRWENLKNLGEWSGGGTPSKSNPKFWNQRDIPWVSPKDMKVKNIASSQDYISKTALEKTNLRLLPEGSLLMVTRSGILAHSFPVAINDVPVTVNQDLKALVLTKELNDKYVFYALRRYERAILKECSKHGTTVHSIEMPKLMRFQLPIAPPEQQKRIVAKIEELFSHIDAGIEALKKAKQLLKQYRQSVLKAAVTGELTKEWREENNDKLEPAAQLLERINTEREQEFERKIADWEVELAQWKSGGEKSKKPAKPKKPKNLEPISDDKLKSLGDLPEGWMWTRLGNLTVDVFDGPFGSNLKSSDYVEEGIRVIRLENIGNLEFKDEKQSFVTPEKYESLKKHTVGSGDLIFSSFVADGTRVVVLPNYVDKAVNKADCFCIRCFGRSVYNSYLALFLATNTAYKRLENEVHGATRPRINTTQLKNIEVPICTIDEQQEAVRILELKFDAIARLEVEIDEKLLMVDKNKQSVLASAFSGRLYSDGITSVSTKVENC